MVETIQPVRSPNFLNNMIQKIAYTGQRIQSAYGCDSDARMENVAVMGDVLGSDRDWGSHQQRGSKEILGGPRLRESRGMAVGS